MKHDKHLILNDSRKSYYTSRKSLASWNLRTNQKVSSNVQINQKLDSYLFYVFYFSDNNLRHVEQPFKFVAVLSIRPNGDSLTLNTYM